MVMAVVAITGPIHTRPIREDGNSNRQGTHHDIGSDGSAATEKSSMTETRAKIARLVIARPDTGITILKITPQSLQPSTGGVFTSTGRVRKNCLMRKMPKPVAAMADDPLVGILQTQLDGHHGTWGDPDMQRDHH
jgi:hypothetical protein